MAERAHPEDQGFQKRLFGLAQNPYREKLFERYRFCNSYVEGKVILDIPCGVGWGTSLLRRASYVIGADISKEAIHYARQHYGNRTRRFLVADMKSIPLRDNTIDVTLCLEGFEHVSKETGVIFITELKRVVRIKGLIAMTCPVINEFGRSTNNPYHLYEYPEEELINLLNAHFRILELEMIKGPDGPEYKALLCNVKNIRRKDGC
jgi:ubiquinone/menaquinone biosynthesis C-methylase UbiE